MNHLHERLVHVLEALDTPFEIILVDDGSSDDTFERVRSIAGADPRVRGVRLTRNYGQQIALLAGMDAARGEKVVIIDGDLQKPPEAIPALLRELDAGRDAAFGVRRRRHGSWSRRVGSRLTLAAIGRVCETGLPSDMTGFMALNRPLVAEIVQCRDRCRFLMGLAVELSNGRWSEVPIEETRRAKHSSKYRFSDLFMLAAQFIALSSLRPLAWILIAGFLLAAIGLLGGLVAGTLFAAGIWNACPSLLLGFAFATAGMGGVQLVALGMAAQYIGLAFTESQSRPVYAVRERAGP